MWQVENGLNKIDLGFMDKNNISRMICFPLLDIVDVSSMVRSNSSMNGSTGSSNGLTGTSNGFTGSSRHKSDFNNSFPPRKRSIPLGESWSTKHTGNCSVFSWSAATSYFVFMYSLFIRYLFIFSSPNVDFLAAWAEITN